MSNLAEAWNRNARRRRRFHAAVAAFWILPGGILSIIFPNSLAWIVFMSWFACVYAAVSAYAAETPVEKQDSKQ